jgi:hypothetical protein
LIARGRGEIGPKKAPRVKKILSTKSEKRTKIRPLLDGLKIHIFFPQIVDISGYESWFSKDIFVALRDFFLTP